MNVSDAELSSLGAVGGESPRETCLRSFGWTHVSMLCGSFRISLLSHANSCQSFNILTFHIFSTSACAVFSCDWATQRRITWFLVIIIIICPRRRMHRAIALIRLRTWVAQRKDKECLNANTIRGMLHVIYFTQCSSLPNICSSLFHHADESVKAFDEGIWSLWRICEGNPCLLPTSV